MSERRSSPNLSASVLRDHATAPRVERIWQRLEGSLVGREPPRRAQQLWVGSVLAVAASFAGGVLVGQRLDAEDAVSGVAPEPLPALEARPRLEPPREQLEPEKRTAPLGPKKASRLRRAKPEAAPAVSVAVPSPAAAALVPVVPSWYLLADRGDFDAASRALDATGGFDAVVKTAAVDELMALADVARATGNRRRALQAWREIGQRFPESDHAPLAALMSGNVLLQSGDHAGAAEAFERVRTLNPSGPHVQDALAGEFDVAVDQGDTEQADKLAAEYARRFPDGPRLGEMQRQLEKLLEEGQRSLSSGEASAGTEANEP